MTFYLIGLGLDVRGISLHGKKILKNCRKIYLENYTVDFPYTRKELEKELKIRVIEANREMVESENLIEEAKKAKDAVALLVYGSPLMATTHISLINRARKDKVKYKVIQAASIYDGICETGLHIYKFGKTASLPRWQKNFTPESFIDIIKENKSIKAHTLLLVDIGLKFDEAREQLEKTKYNLFDKEKIIVCSKIGTKRSKIFYDRLKNIDEKKIDLPYCIIIPEELHFSEEEALMSVVRN
ncbi:MAG: diphthine synthase [Candidatus Pacearchaeota archaeon]|jgi:diphthine synthase